MEANTQVVSFKQIKEWVAYGKTEEALDMLILKAGDFDKEASLLHARFENLKMRIIGGTISEENRNVETNSINQAALALIEEIEENKGRKKKARPASGSIVKSLERGFFMIGSGVKWAIIASIAAAIALPSILNGLSEGPAARPQVEFQNGFYGNPGETADHESHPNLYLNQDIDNNDWFDFSITNMICSDQQITLELELQSLSNIAIQIAPFELSDIDQDVRVLINNEEAERLGKIELAAHDSKTITMSFDHAIGHSRAFVLATSFEVSNADHQEATALVFDLVEE